MTHPNAASGASPVSILNEVLNEDQKPLNTRQCHYVLLMHYNLLYIVISLLRVDEFFIAI
jgi:hypothetical protein